MIHSIFACNSINENKNSTINEKEFSLFLENATRIMYCIFVVYISNIK